MDVKINSTVATTLTQKTNQQPDKSAGFDTRQSGNNATPRTVDAVNDADKILITASARLMQALENQIADSPVVDNDRVNAMKQIMNDGKFDMNSQRTAEKFVSFELQLAPLR